MLLPQVLQLLLPQVLQLEEPPIHFRQWWWPELPQQPELLLPQLLQLPQLLLPQESQPQLLFFLNSPPKRCLQRFINPSLQQLEPQSPPQDPPQAPPTIEPE